jgi:hypothetical protein
MREEAALRQLKRHIVEMVTRVCSSPELSRGRGRQMAGQQERAPQTYSDSHLLTALMLPLHILAIPIPPIARLDATHRLSLFSGLPFRPAL